MTRDQYRNCAVCKTEYRPKREAQSYCSPRCRREAAYGRERFQSGTRGRRKRRLEASDASHFEADHANETLSATGVAGSFRNGPFSPIKTVSCRRTFPPIEGPIDILGGRMRGSGLDRETRERILWCEVGPLTRINKGGLNEG
jgi:hypothetical protein